MDPPHSYILEEGICYLALCDPTYPAKLAFNYLENLHKDFSEQHGNDVHKASRPYHFIEFGMYLYLPSIFCRLNYKVMLFSCVSIGHAQLGNTSTCSFLCVYCFNSVLLPLLYIIQNVLPLTPTTPPHTHTLPPPHTHSPPPPHTHVQISVTKRGGWSTTLVPEDNG